MYGIVNPTPFDLDFRLLGIPVRVSGWFWLAGAFLGFSTLKAGVPFLLVWLLVLFVSILVHEFGHALTSRYFGYPSQILLYHFGGLALSHRSARNTKDLWQSIAITFAGPLAGFGLYGVLKLFTLYGGGLFSPDMNLKFLELMTFALGVGIYINFYWGLINLLPVLPLDGGQIFRDFCLMFSRSRGELYATRVSVVVAAVAAIGLYQQHHTFAAILFAMFCISNIQDLQRRGGW